MPESVVGLDTELGCKKELFEGRMRATAGPSVYELVCARLAVLPSNTITATRNALQNAL
jgi:hypothetical protein